MHEDYFSIMMNVIIISYSQRIFQDNFIRKSQAHVGVPNRREFAVKQQRQEKQKNQQNKIIKNYNNVHVNYEIVVMMITMGQNIYSKCDKIYCSYVQEL